MLPASQIGNFEQLKLCQTTVPPAVLETFQKQEQHHMIEMLDASSKGDAKKVRKLIDRGISPSCADYDKRTALMVAAQVRGRKEGEGVTGGTFWVYLFGGGWGGAPVSEGLVFGVHISLPGCRIYQFVLSSVPSHPPLPWSASHAMSQEGRDIVVEILIDAKARIHELDIFGTNALVGAIRRNHTQVIEILLEAGATLNLCTAVRGREEGVPEGAP